MPLASLSKMCFLQSLAEVQHEAFVGQIETFWIASLLNRDLMLLQAQVAFSYVWCICFSAIRLRWVKFSLSIEDGFQGRPGVAGHFFFDEHGRPLGPGRLMLCLPREPYFVDSNEWETVSRNLVCVWNMAGQLLLYPRGGGYLGTIRPLEYPDSPPSPLGYNKSCPAILECWGHARRMALRQFLTSFWSVLMLWLFSLASRWPDDAGFV